MLVWSLAVPVLKRAVSLPSLARLMWSSGIGPRDLAKESAIVRLTWWTSRVQPRRFPDNCLERSLVAYRFLARAGARPRLVTGVGRDGAELVGHVWVTVDGEPVHDRVESLRAYKTLVEFGEHGLPVHGEDALGGLAGRAADSFPAP
jgi:hypothetical protein